MGKYPAEVFNIRNAATNLTEIIADAARSDDTGDHKIRIFTIGMGSLVKMNLGTIPETSESVLMRIANDKKSPDYNSAQLEGQVLLRADRGRPRPGVPAAAEPDHQAEQVTPLACSPWPLAPYAPGGSRSLQTCPRTPRRLVGFLGHVCRSPAC